MTTPLTTVTESQIADWRRHLLAQGSLAEPDADELEDHLRTSIGDLIQAGLTQDEAFLIAIRRIGSLNEVARQYASTSATREWKQHVGTMPTARRLGDWIVVIFAVVAALAVQAPRLWGAEESAAFTSPTLALLALAGYLAATRRVDRWWLIAGGAVGLVALIAPLALPFEPYGDTWIIAVLHLPVAMWFVVAATFTGGKLSSTRARMDAVRFCGEWAIYMALIALGGGVLLAITFGTMAAAGFEPSEDLVGWLLPSAAAGAMPVAAWLVEGKSSVIENLAPVLTRIFTPLFAAAVSVLLVTAAVAGGFGDNREVLILIDVLLIVVVALVLYTLSATRADARAGWFEWLQVALVVAALALSLVALVSTFERSLDEFGLTPNRVAALGLNLILMVNLVVTAWLGIVRAVKRDVPGRMIAWQAGFLPVYALWAWLMVLALPAVFGFA